MYSLNAGLFICICLSKVQTSKSTNGYHHILMKIKYLKDLSKLQLKLKDLSKLQIYLNFTKYNLNYN